MTRSTAEQIRVNILALLERDQKRPSDLAFAIKKHRSWMTRFLNRQRDELQLKDVDGIAEFFQVAPYDLFQPSTGSITDRRKLRVRRSGLDRRVRDAQRAMLMASELGRARSPAARKGLHVAAEASSDRGALTRLIEKFLHDASPLLRQEDARGQTPLAGGTVPRVRPTRRVVGGPDDPQPPPKPLKPK